MNRRPRRSRGVGTTGPGAGSLRRVGTPRRVQGDRGTALTESAFVLPVLLYLVMACVEGGLLLRNWNAVTDSVENGTRAASVAGNDVNSDWEILQAIRIASGVVPRQTIERIVVYRASSPGAGPTAQCMAGTASATDRCNVYSRSDMQRAETQFGCVTANQLDSFWCPTGRETTSGSTDLVGVWIRAQHDYVTGLFGDDVTIEDFGTLPLEANR